MIKDKRIVNLYNPLNCYKIYTMLYKHRPMNLGSRKMSPVGQKEAIMQKVISTDKAPSAIGPYSQAIEVNGMVYTSGVIPVDPPTGQIVEGGVEAQANQAFKNLINLVEASGSKAENIVKTTVFIKEMNDFGKINEIYKNYFKEPFPARSCVEVARLPKDVLLEVEAIAWK
jgi:2-iminobutanoate/2-iminopropanoate deaminase